MGIRQAGVLRQIDCLWNLGAFGAMTDAQLLARFAARNEDGAELAFEVLLDRHGPMVFRVCRGLLGDDHAAEDAFQATFLVLARKVRSLSVNDSLGSWLHGVAQRVASRARSDAARRRRHELRLTENGSPAYEVMPDPGRSDVVSVLHEEIARLPEKYQAPIVLCYLEAMSYKAAASRLGVTEDAVRGRLARARERLRKRFAHRGVELSGVLAVARPSALAALPRPGLVLATARAAMSHSAGGMASSGLIPRSVVSLSERTCRTMMLNKLRAAAAASVVGLIAAGAVVLAQPAAGHSDQTTTTATTGQPPRADPVRGGNLIVDWMPADGKGGKKEIVVDPKRHCIHLSAMSVKRDDRPNDGIVRLDLERGKTYTVTASGEAFMSAQTGVNADPFAGVVLVYSTDEEDCFAERQTILTSGKSITFRSPWLIDPKSEGYVMAFFLDTWPGHPKRGRYTLTITETGEPAASTGVQGAVRRIGSAADDSRESIWLRASMPLIQRQAKQLVDAPKDRASSARRDGSP